MAENIKNIASKCCYCGACVSVCPANCIELKETKIIIDHEKCINCQNCVRICPTGAMQPKNKE